MKIKLKKAIEYKSAEYKEIDMDLDALTGAQLIKAKGQLSVQPNQPINLDTIAPQLSMEFQARIAAEASGVPYEVIQALPAKDFVQVTNAVRDFLA